MVRTRARENGKVAVNRSMSLDGFTADPGDAINWIFDFMEPIEDEFPEIMAATGAMLVGQRPYEVGKRMTENPNEVTPAYGGGAEFVLTHEPPDPPDPAVTFLTGDIGEAVATALRAAGGKNLEIRSLDRAHPVRRESRLLGVCRHESAPSRFARSTLPGRSAPGRSRSAPWRPWATATDLAGHGDAVTLMVRGNDLAAGVSSCLADRILAHDGITVRIATEVIALRCGSHFEAITVHTAAPGDLSPASPPGGKAWRPRRPGSSPTRSASRTTTSTSGSATTGESLWGFGAFPRARPSSAAAPRTGRRGGQGPGAAACRRPAGGGTADLRIAGGEIFAAREPKHSISVAEVARVACLQSSRLPEGIEPGLEATRFYDPTRGAFAVGAQAAAIEVNRVTGRLKILRYVCVGDSGRAMHPRIVDGQIMGAIAQGIGGAMYEQLVYDDNGNLYAGTLHDYLMPASAEVPDMVIGHVPQPANNPLGVRGVGEGGTLGPSAVVAGALADALGIHVGTLPITPASVWKELQ